MPLEGREKCVFKCVNVKGVGRHIFSTLDRARVTLPPASNLYAKLGYLNLNSNPVLFFLIIINNLILLWVFLICREQQQQPIRGVQYICGPERC